MDTIPGSEPMENPPHAPLCGLDPADLLKQGAADDTFMDGAGANFNPPPIEELAAIFPQIEILELIGKGGMGAVYKVRQKDLDRIVALKILPPGIRQSLEFSNRFTREAKALAKLNHPGIVTLHEFGQQDGLYFILMEFVDGMNLAQLMKTGRVSPREALAIVPQICDALQFAHDQGIVHRDIKPENILLDRLGRVKVADFGIAKVVASVCEDPIRRGDIPVSTDQTLAGKIIGTPQYMAPEQIDHPSDVDHRADIYALGVVFYQMLTGELPGKDLQAPSRKVHIDTRLDEMVLRALEKEPLLRYQTAREFRTSLDTIESPQQKTDEASFSLSKPSTGQGKRFSIGRIIIGCILFGLLMGVREEFQAIWIRSAIAGLAAALGYLVAYSRSRHDVDETVKTAASTEAAKVEKKPSRPRSRKIKWIVAACLVVGALWFIRQISSNLDHPVKVGATALSEPQGGVSPASVPSVQTSGMLLEKKLAEYDWSELTAEGLLGDGVLETEDDRSVLKIENLNDAPMQARILSIERPPINATRYAVSGEVRYENVQGQAYLEMWSDFPEGRYFSRTLGDPGSGPMSQLTGTSVWRKFILPFDRTGTKSSPTRIEVNLFLPGRGMVFVGPLKLTEASPGEDGHARTQSSIESRDDNEESQDRMIAKMAEQWLAGIDAGDYTRSWNEAAAFFQNAITAENWSATMMRFRKPLGALKSRKFADMKAADVLPGAPDGKYWIIQFDASFAEKAKAVETVTLMLEKNGSWKPAGYIIR